MTNKTKAMQIIDLARKCLNTSGGNDYYDYLAEEHFFGGHKSIEAFYNAAVLQEREKWQADAEPVGINGLTQAETDATMSVRGLSEPVDVGMEPVVQASSLIPHNGIYGALYTADQLAAAIAQEREKWQADMFWNSDDAEKPHGSISCFLNNEICHGPLEVGAVFTIWQAKKLPAIQIRVTSIDENESEADYEIIDAARTGEQK